MDEGGAGSDAGVAAKGDFVALSYTLTLDNGNVVDSAGSSSPSGELFETEIGTGGLLPGVENAIVGMKPGETAKVRLGKDEAFGPYNDELVFTFPKSQLGPDGGSVAEGTKVQLGTGDIARITVVTDDAVTIDANHVLAGEPLTFDLALESILAKAEDVSIATVAGGCFWGLELAYQRQRGVLGTSVGYTQGEVENPSYEEVCSGATGHTEAVQIKYDPSVISFESLLDVFFDRVNPTQLNQQGNDRGTQYRSGIYYHSPDQKAATLAAMEAAQAQWGEKPIVTECLPASKFWGAEDYHQQYLQKGGQDASKGATDTIRCYG